MRNDSGISAFFKTILGKYISSANLLHRSALVILLVFLMSSNNCNSFSLFNPLTRADGLYFLITFLMLATLMIPGEMLIITNFITITKLKWINTYQAMIVPYLASVFYIYLLTQFFSQVPDALYLAAKVDKCNDFKYLIKIMIPINKSPIPTVCILNAIGCWNSFMWPLLVTNSKEMRVLSYGLMQFQTENGSSYELIMAASCILVLPIVVVYLILRKYVIEGVTQSGIKG